MIKQIADQRIIEMLRNNGYVCEHSFREWFSTDIDLRHRQPMVLPGMDAIVMVGSRIMWLHEHLDAMYQKQCDSEKFLQKWDHILAVNSKEE